jgi:hypothetical protein
MGERPDVQPLVHVPRVYETIQPPNWEYHVMTIDTREETLPDVVQLNALGQEGWILVSVLDERTTSKGSRLHYYFVRQEQK